MQALLLAAGRSRRFWPLPDKNFLRFGEQTLIEQQIENLKKSGVKKFIIVGGRHNLKQLKKLFPRHQVLEQKRLGAGMAGAVLTAKQYLTEPTLIVSTNDIFEASAIKKVLNVKNCAGTILARQVTDYFPGGYLKIKNGRILDIIEKPKPGKEPSSLVNLVCHFFRDPSKFVRMLQKVSQKNDDGYERALAKLFQTEKFVAVKYTGAWQAVKYPWHMLGATQQFLGNLKRIQISKKSRIAKTAVITGPVLIEDGVKIFDFAVITGPAWIGRNSIVGTHSLVRESIIGANSVVGSGSEVARSHLGEHVWLHRNYVGDSVLADNVSLGADAVTANLRLDEGEVKPIVQGKKLKTGTSKFGCAVGSGCRIGVSTNIMPGILIGGNTLIGSGLTISKNIPDSSFVTGKMKLKVGKNKKVVASRNKFKN